jgi:excisionase family DNA binding protein
VQQSYQPVDNLGDELLDADVAGERFGVSRATLWRWVRDGRLTAYKFGPRKVRYRMADLQALLTPVDQQRRANADQRAAVQAILRLNAAILRRRGGRAIADGGDLVAGERAEREGEL